MFSFLAVGLTLLIAAMVPGPDFIVVTKNATLVSFRAGIATAMGVATAVLVHATYSIGSVGFIATHWTGLYHYIRYLGALYLAYLGLRLLIQQQRAIASEAPEKVYPTPWSQSRPFVEGFGSNLLNPKAIMFFVGIFSQVLEPHASLQTKLLLVIEAGTVVGLWFSALVVLLNTPCIKVAIHGRQRTFEKVMAILLIGFAIKLFLQRAS